MNPLSRQAPGQGREVAQRTSEKPVWSPEGRARVESSVLGFIQGTGTH